MSAPKLDLILSPLARADFRDILQYTVRTWGTRQYAEYRSALDRALKTIMNNPRIGTSRDDLRPGLRSFQVRQHAIYYRIEPEVIRVDRILHVRMDIARELGE